MSTRHKHADVIIAWAEGKDVQVWDKFHGEWRNVDNDAVYFMAEYKYRIKPITKKYRVALLKDSREFYALAVNSQDYADTMEQREGFVRWLTDWVEYEE